jgi:hypothetical protein
MPLLETEGLGAEEEESRVTALQAPALTFETHSKKTGQRHFMQLTTFPPVTNLLCKDRTRSQLGQDKQGSALLPDAQSGRL